MDTSVGGGLYFRAKVPNGAPCVHISFAEGKRKDEKPDAENAMFFVLLGGRVYHFTYVLGPLDDFGGITTGPGEAVLTSFLAGFKPLK